MLDKTLLSRVKSATVAIGVMTLKPGKPNKVDEVRVYGTGFFVDNTGYVMTANHVANSCHQFIQQKGHGGLVAIRLLPLSGGSFRASTIDMGQTYPIMLGRASDVQNSDFSQSLDLDVAVLRPKEPQPDTPFLQIKSISQLNIHDSIYEKVAMCGYPSGEKSLNAMGGPLSLRLSPVMQFGRIVGLLPTDNAPGPSGIQTDIIATGGSSGSPIIDLDSGEVLAIAQNVLPAEIFGNAAVRRKDKPEVIDKGIISGMSKIGLVYGRSYNSLERIPEGARSDLEKGVPYRSASNITLYGHQGWEKR